MHWWPRRVPSNAGNIKNASSACKVRCRHSNFEAGAIANVMRQHFEGSSGLKCSQGAVWIHFRVCLAKILKFPIVLGLYLERVPWHDVPPFSINETFYVRSSEGSWVFPGMHKPNTRAINPFFRQLSPSFMPHFSILPWAFSSLLMFVLLMATDAADGNRIKYILKSFKVKWNVIATQFVQRCNKNDRLIV